MHCPVRLTGRPQTRLPLASPRLPLGFPRPSLSPPRLAYLARRLLSHELRCTHSAPRWSRSYEDPPLPGQGGGYILSTAGVGQADGHTREGCGTYGADDALVYIWRWTEMITSESDSSVKVETCHTQCTCTREPPPCDVGRCADPFCKSCVAVTAPSGDLPLNVGKPQPHDTRKSKPRARAASKLSVALLAVETAEEATDHAHDEQALKGGKGEAKADSGEEEDVAPIRPLQCHLPQVNPDTGIWENNQYAQQREECNDYCHGAVSVTSVFGKLFGNSSYFKARTEGYGRYQE